MPHIVYTKTHQGPDDRTRAKSGGGPSTVPEVQLYYSTVVTIYYFISLDFPFRPPHYHRLFPSRRFFLARYIGVSLLHFAPTQAIGRQKGQPKSSAARSNPIGLRVVRICRKKREHYSPESSTC